MIKVPGIPKSLDDYANLIDPEVSEDIRTVSAQLRDLRVVHINATPAGGGVAEVLRSLVPLMEDGGLRSSWYVVEPHKPFFEVTKKIHNGLQGKTVELSPDEVALYREHNERLAERIAELESTIDLLILHDPQVLPSLLYLGWKNVIWHCHIDTSTPHQPIQDLVLPYVRSAPRYVVSMPHYVMDGMPQERISVFPPAIDPLSPKNLPLSSSIASEVLSKLGIDLARPLVTQVSRFDPWKDPWGVIDAFRLAREKIPSLQLALVGAMVAQDDPESADMLESVRNHADNDPDIHIYSESADGADIPVNAFQRLSSVVVQKSLREGFGLTVSEAMWKGAAVIGGDCGGIPYQIEDGVSGYIVSDPAECADRMVELIRQPNLRTELGQAARERVRQKFLTPRLLLDYLKIIRDMTRSANDDAAARAPEVQRTTA